MGTIVLRTVLLICQESIWQFRCCLEITVSESLGIKSLVLNIKRIFRPLTQMLKKQLCKNNIISNLVSDKAHFPTSPPPLLEYMTPGLHKPPKERDIVHPF